MGAQSGEEVGLDDARSGGGGDVLCQPGVLEGLGSCETGVGVDGEAALDEVASCEKALELRRRGEGRDGPVSETPCQYSAGSKA